MQVPYKPLCTARGGSPTTTTATIQIARNAALHKERKTSFFHVYMNGRLIVPCMLTVLHKRLALDVPDMFGMIDIHCDDGWLQLNRSGTGFAKGPAWKKFMGSLDHKVNLFAKAAVG